MKTKKKFGMRRHIGITAAATLIALGATACDDSIYWGGKKNQNTYNNFVDYFGSEDGSFDFEKVVVCGTRQKDDQGKEISRVMSANCLWNQNAEGNGENSKACSDDSIQHLKILWVPDNKDDTNYTRYMAICTRWSYGSTKTDVEWDGSKLKDIGKNSLTYGSCNNSPLKCNEGDDECKKILCEKVAYYKYTRGKNGKYKFVSCSDESNNQTCDPVDEEMSAAFKSAFNFHACPVGYTFASSYLVSSEHGMNNVCVKSVCGDKPVDLNSDNENCGLCGKKCGNGVTCSNGSCVVADKSKVLCKGEFINPENDPRYCGAKGDCSDTNPSSTDYRGVACEGATPLCSNGRCANACVGGQIVCDGRCVDPQTDMKFCGATGNCKDENAGEECTNGRFCSGALCATSCQEGLFLCDDKCVDGTTNPYYCGVTSDCTETNNGTKCEDTQVCVSGKCVYNSCKEPETLCSTTGGNQCINIESDDADNCGSCGYKCKEHPVSNAIANGCIAGVCQYKCTDSTENVGIDNTAAKIHCVDVSVDVNNCGRKGRKCEEGQVCVNSDCVQNSCTNPEETLCATEHGNICKDVKNADADNCGTCGYKCADHPVANATANGCIKGVCQYKCINGTENVGSDTTAEKISCVDISVDVNNCGRKGKKCESGQVCVKSNCVLNNCPKGEVLCEINGQRVCKDVKGTDISNCGGCGVSCDFSKPLNSHVKECSQGICKYECNDKYEKIGTGETANSMQCVDLSSDNRNCGRVGDSCKGGKVCVGGNCVVSCTSENQIVCGEQCVEPSSSKTNCGAKGNCNSSDESSADYQGAKCGDKQVCAGGKCVNNSCNSVNSCPSVTGGNNQCVSGVCVLTCNEGWFQKIDESGKVTNECVKASDTSCGYNNQKTLINCGNSHCETSSLKCVECVNNTHCQDNDKRICHTTNKKCVGCQDNTHCNDVNAIDQYCNGDKCKVVSCKVGWHVSTTGTTCTKDTIDACGAIPKDCKELPGLASPAKNSVECIAGECKATVCNSQTHYLDGAVCTQNDINHCGSAENDCTTLDGIDQSVTDSAECDKGVCKAKKCNSETHYLDGDVCKPNDRKHCGSPSNDCTSIENLPKSNKEDAVDCVAGKCQVKNCGRDYQVSEDKTQCEKKELACGEKAVDCTAISNLGEGDDAVACVEGNCKVNRCEAGYYISGNSCRLCPGTYDVNKTAQVVTSDGIKCQYKCFYASWIKDCTPDGVDGAVYDRPEDLVCLRRGNGWKSADYDSEIIPDWSEYDCRICNCRKTGIAVDWDRANMRCVCLN